MERSYIAFISYKHTQRDAAIAKQVHTLIENYVIPKSLRKDSRKLGIVFRDEEELPMSSDLTESICTALDASRFLIVICSPESKESIWVSREVNYFLKNHPARDAFVVLADGEPGDVFFRELTHVLNEKTGEYQEVEPLALDVRADSIGASLRKLRQHIKKLYAGMLGCSYDSLVQREKSRRMKRIAALAAVCVLLAGCFTGMLFAKNRELSQKNDQLTAAIDLALTRESELLVEKANEALLNEDVPTAVQYAIDALSSGETERPYYAPAERALFAAVDALQEVSPLLLKVELEHSAPIEMMAYSADGGTVFTVDSYGTVSSFDSASGGLFWSAKLRESPDDLIMVEPPQLWYDGADNIIACFYNNILSGLDASTGALVWQTVLEATPVSKPLFDGEGQKIAYIGRIYHFDPDDASKSCTEYSLFAFSAKDGSLLSSIPLMNVPDGSILNTVNFDGYSDDRSYSAFAGPDRFVGMVSVTENSVSKTQFYIADLAKNTVTYIENPSLDEYLASLETPFGSSDLVGAFYLGSDRALALSSKSEADIVTGYSAQNLFLQCYDLNTGALLWENTSDSEKHISAFSMCFVLPGTKSIMIGVGENLCAIDPENGETQGYTALESELIDLYPLMDGLYAFALDDGYCAVGWRNQNGMYDSRLYGSTVDLPETYDIISHNGGLIQEYVTGNTIDGFGFLPLAEGGGSVTYLSTDRRTAYVASILPNRVLLESIPVEAADGSAAESGTFADVNPQGKVLMTLTNSLKVVDTENHTFVTLEPENYSTLSSTDFYLTADGQSVIMCSPNGDIRIFGVDGADSTIAESETIILRDYGDMQTAGDTFKADAARLAADGRILAARSDGRQLTYWIDGSEETSVPLPEDVRWSVSDYMNIWKMIHTGENGLMVLSDFPSEDAREIEHFAVYDLSGKQWKLIPDAARGTVDRLIAFGEKTQAFAVYDADMNIRIYDWNAAEPACLNTGLPAVSVVKIGMLLDDRYLYVLTKDGRFTVYCIETNEMAFRTTLNDTMNTDRFSIWTDRENDRLYLRASETGQCIDLRTWELLFEKTDFKFYSAAQNEIYTYDFDPETSSYPMKATPVPATSELIRMAQDFLKS